MASEYLTDSENLPVYLGRIEEDGKITSHSYTEQLTKDEILKFVLINQDTTDNTQLKQQLDECQTKLSEAKKTKVILNTYANELLELLINRSSNPTGYDPHIKSITTILINKDISTPYDETKYKIDTAQLETKPRIILYSTDFCNELVTIINKPPPTTEIKDILELYAFLQTEEELKELYNILQTNYTYISLAKNTLDQYKTDINIDLLSTFIGDPSSYTDFLNNNSHSVTNYSKCTKILQKLYIMLYQSIKLYPSSTHVSDITTRYNTCKLTLNNSTKIKDFTMYKAIQEYIIYLSNFNIPNEIPTEIPMEHDQLDQLNKMYFTYSHPTEDEAEFTIFDHFDILCNNWDIYSNWLSDDLRGAVRIYIKERPDKVDKKKKQDQVSTPTNHNYYIVQETRPCLLAQTLNVDSQNPNICKTSEIPIMTGSVTNDSHSKSIEETVKTGIINQIDIIFFGYGFSGSGKTRVLIGEETPPVDGILQLIIKTVNDMDDCNITDINFVETYLRSNYLYIENDNSNINDSVQEVDLTHTLTQSTNTYTTTSSIDNYMNNSNLKITHKFSPMISPERNDVNQAFNDQYKIIKENRIKERRQKMTKNNPDSSRSNLCIKLTGVYKSKAFTIQVIDMAGAEGPIDIANDAFNTSLIEYDDIFWQQSGIKQQGRSAKYKPKSVFFNHSFLQKLKMSDQSLDNRSDHDRLLSYFTQINDYGLDIPTRNQFIAKTVLRNFKNNNTTLQIFQVYLNKEFFIHISQPTKGVALFNAIKKQLKSIVIFVNEDEINTSTDNYINKLMNTIKYYYNNIVTLLKEDQSDSKSSDKPYNRNPNNLSELTVDDISDQIYPFYYSFTHHTDMINDQSILNDQTILNDYLNIRKHILNKGNRYESNNQLLPDIPPIVHSDILKEFLNPMKIYSENFVSTYMIQWLDKEKSTQESKIKVSIFYEMIFTLMLLYHSPDMIEGDGELKNDLMNSIDGNAWFSMTINQIIYTQLPILQDCVKQILQFLKINNRMEGLQIPELIQVIIDNQDNITKEQIRTIIDYFCNSPIIFIIINECLLYHTLDITKGQNQIGLQYNTIITNFMKRYEYDKVDVYDDILDPSSTQLSAFSTMKLTYLKIFMVLVMSYISSTLKFDEIIKNIQNKTYENVNTNMSNDLKKGELYNALKDLLDKQLGPQSNQYITIQQGFGINHSNTGLQKLISMTSDGTKQNGNDNTVKTHDTTNIASYQINPIITVDTFYQDSDNFTDFDKLILDKPVYGNSWYNFQSDNTFYDYIARSLHDDTLTKFIMIGTITGMHNKRLETLKTLEYMNSLSLFRCEEKNETSFFSYTSAFRKDHNNECIINENDFFYYGKSKRGIEFTENKENQSSEQIPTMGGGKKYNLHQILTQLKYMLKKSYDYTHNYNKTIYHTLHFMKSKIRSEPDFNKKVLYLEVIHLYKELFGKLQKLNPNTSYSKINKTIIEQLIN